MQIRRAAPADLAAVGEVTVAAYSPFLLGPDDPYAERLRDAAARAEQAELWVAVSDDGHGPAEVLGSVTTCPVGSPWREIAQPGEGELRMLSVAPGAQGQGVGAALVEHVLDHYRRAGARAVVLSSLVEMTSAHRLYARHGFTRLPERDWSPVPDVHLIAFGTTLGGTR
ncbi:GNAT family N-acetyltransferase [uncultured Nocardioides sp.]|uniref:GNAT family N-acetyltransferase n=1 Tax=uncultured Nocardioides sp. TaxID=198441 RepID=UPI0026166A43|nr:GNAT family N-acetyltransferase [uncultured Nocardioides sp.]